MNNPSLLDLYHYIPAAFLLLAAVRFGPAGAAGSLSIMSLLAVLATSASRSGSSIPPATDGVLSLQLFLLVIGIPIMSLSVLIEQQHRTEQSLRESETRFRTMADTAPVMIWITGPNEVATFFNSGWLEFTGRDIEQAVNDGWSSRVHPDQRAHCLASHSSAFGGRRLWHAECQLRRADGEYRSGCCAVVLHVSPPTASLQATLFPAPTSAI